MVHIPIWLLVAGILVLAVPAVYFVYDAFCKPEDVNPGEDDGGEDGGDFEDVRDYEAVPAVYFVYDALCKPEDVNPGMPCMVTTIRIVRMCPQSMMLAKMMITRLL